MNNHSIVVAALVLIASSAVAETPQPASAEQRPPVREQTLLQDVAAGMRELLRAVTPEISLPKLELKLPTLDAHAR